MSAGFDSLVIGAGAAGLAAAAELARGGHRVCVLEARDRVGGRIFTRQEPGLPVPLELGAEFIHGSPPATLHWLNEPGLIIPTAPRSRWTGRGGRLSPADELFAELRRGLATAPRPREDMAFSRFLDAIPGEALPQRAREFARRLVEGFDAADATRISTFEVLDEWCGDSAADASSFRPRRGYATLLDAIFRQLDPEKVVLRLNAPVRELKWSRGRVTAAATQYGQPVSVDARRAIVSVPLAVLKLSSDERGALRFTPDIEAARALLPKLETGAALKVVFRFPTAFWESLDDGRYRDATFFHSPGAPFPTFWSMLPLRGPVLAAWVAGPAALALAGAAKGEIVGAALESTRTLFGPHPEPQGVYVHDWQTDPYARGAYSYAAVGGILARSTLAQPIEDTLFLVGEALDTQGESGTVAGALQSGQRAARRILDSF